MKIRPDTFEKMRKVLLDRGPLDEVELVYSISAVGAEAGATAAAAQPITKDGVVRVLQYLEQATDLYERVGGGPSDTIDIVDAGTGLRATVGAPDAGDAAAASAPLLPLPADAAVIRKERLRSVGLPSYRMRLNLKRETPVGAGAGDRDAQQAFSPLRAGSGQLTYRLKRRYSYSYRPAAAPGGGQAKGKDNAAAPASYMRVDVTAVRMLTDGRGRPPTAASGGGGGWPREDAGGPEPRRAVPTYADVSRQQETYEMEVEWVGPADGTADAKRADGAVKAMLGRFSVLLKLLDGAVATVLSLEEQGEVEAEYRRLVAALGGAGAAPASGRSARFIGPKPVTLEAEHVRCACDGPAGAADSEAPCVLNDYTVTPKADGERRLMLVGADGRAYTIDDRIGVMDTGLACRARRNCVLDGEHVEREDAPPFFLVFDAYIVDGVDVRPQPLMLEPAAPAAALGAAKSRGARSRRAASSPATRLDAAASVIRDLAPPSASASAAAGYSVELKEFRYIAEPRLPLADACRHFFRLRDAGGKGLGYETDGLVFTPALLPVPPGSGTWPAVLKWKPPELNTIDFQVRLRDELVVLEGDDARSVAQLLVGQDPWLARPLTALDYLSGDAGERLRNLKARGRAGSYAAMPFAPDGVDLSLCYLRRTDAGGRLLCASGDEIFDGAVVEFAFDAASPRAEKSGDWAAADPRDVAARWRPLRVRWDKTTRASRTGDVTANNFVAAASVWHTIVRPISEADLERGPVRLCEVVREGDGKAEGEGEGEVKQYYVAPSAAPDRARGAGADKAGPDVPMRRFHNYWVKRQSLLMRFPAAAGLGRSIFDFGCGTAGDLNKWLEMGAQRVVGFDKYASNIYNPDLRWKGAYVRLLQLPPQQLSKLQAVFLPVDVSRPIATQAERQVYAAMMDEANGDRDVAQAIWALVQPGAVANARLRRFHGFAAGAFDLATCMFAVHYFFADAETLRTFARNVAAVLRPGGHFVGCCLDGDRVDALLSKDAKAAGDAVEATGGAWRIVRRYDGAFSGAFGKRVDVYMRSIGQQLPEFLVSYAALRGAMAEAGLHPPAPGDCAALGLVGGAATGTFDELFQDMSRARAAQEPGAHATPAVDDAGRMTADDKRYSFLNRWFVFEKKDAGAGAASAGPAGASGGAADAAQTRWRNVVVSKLP